MRIGILGGTFDPIHLGHLCLAEETAEELNLIKVYLIPAALPPHKRAKNLTSFEHRFAMTRLAAQDSDFLKVLDLEGRRTGFSYSIETLQELHRLFGPGLELFFILGLDAFYEIKTWKEYRRIIQFTNLVVVERPGFEEPAWDDFILSLDMGFQREGRGDRFRVPGQNALIVLRNMTHLAVSSSQIREKVQEGKTVRFLVPEAVHIYIKEKGLYRSNGSAG